MDCSAPKQSERTVFPARLCLAGKKKEKINVGKSVRMMQEILQYWKGWRQSENVRECISEVCLPKGLNHLIYEIVDNSVDEHLAGFCSEIQVILEKDGSATVSDNGRGVPVDMHQKGVSAARLVYTTLHAGGKFDDSAYKTSGGLHGVGSSVVNALSAYMDVKISRDGYIHHDRYERGVPVVELENGLLPRIGKTKKTGTTVNFLPDDQIFEKTRFRAEEVKSRLHETAYLNPELTIRL